LAVSADILVQGVLEDRCAIWIYHANKSGDRGS